MISFDFWYHHIDSLLDWVVVIVNYWMRLSTVGRIILAEVCIIFNNCSVTESNDSLTISEKEETWRIAKLFYFILFYFIFIFIFFILKEVRSRKIFRWIFFFLSKLHVALSRFGLKYLVQLHKLGTTSVFDLICTMS